MFAVLGLKLLNSLRRFIVPVKCLKCGHEFKPGADREFTSFREFIGRFPCPKCGFSVGVGEDEKSAAVNPPGSFRQPRNSKIEMRAISERERQIDIPAGGHWGGLLPVTIIWNLFMAPAFYFFVVKGMWPVLGPKIFFSVFFAAGLGLIFGACAMRFSSAVLFLGPEIVRLQRSLLLRRNHDLPTREIDSVRRTMAYGQATEGNDEVRHEITTYHVDVRAGLRAFQFGAALPPADQHWLAWTIRDHVRRCGGTGLPEELSKRTEAIEPGDS